MRLMRDDRGDGAILLDEFGITFPDRKGRGPDLSTPTWNAC